MVVASTGEARAVGQEPALRNPAFLLVALLSGVLTFALRWGAVQRGGLVAVGAAMETASSLPCADPLTHLAVCFPAALLDTSVHSPASCSHTTVRHPFFRPLPPSSITQVFPCPMMPHTPAAPSPGGSFASLSFLATTTPSIYSLVGSLTKVPLSIIGLLVRRAGGTGSGRATPRAAQACAAR